MSWRAAVLAWVVASASPALCVGPIASASASASPILEHEHEHEHEVRPFATWRSARDARALATEGGFVWIATGGGVDRYERATRAHRHFGVEDGLDTLDVRTVETTPAGVVVRTGTSRCSFGSDRFACAPAAPPKPSPNNLTLFREHPVNARLRVGNDGWVATRGAGAFFLPDDDAARAIALEGGNAPASFVHTGAVFRGGLWLGTFDDGVYRVPLDREGEPTGAPRAVTSPARMVNRVVATDGALFVGASEGLFVSRDGATFTRVTAIAPHAITGLAATKDHLWVTSTEALYRLPVSGIGRVERSFVRPGGSHAIQAVAIDAQGSAWLATEDRGVVRVDADGTVHGFDRLAGLPTSWFVAVAADENGGVIASSLRHGSMQIARDGSWSPLRWAPNAWGLGVHHDAAGTCLATQGGAACAAGDGEKKKLALLPDPRVHLVLPIGRSLLVGTEAGVALYRL